MSRLRTIALGLAALAALVAAAALATGTPSSTAAFTTASESRLEASAASIGAWLNLYSQDTDPQNDSGYATQVGNSLPAATGQDDGMDVFFDINTNGTYTHRQVLKVRTPATFPITGVTSVKVTVSILPDPDSGLQPVSKYGVDAWGGGSTYTKTITGWAAGTQRQLNLQTKFPGKKFGAGLYEPTVVLSLTYTGFTTTYYQYAIPVRIQYR